MAPVWAGVVLGGLHMLCPCECRAQQMERACHSIIVSCPAGRLGSSNVLPGLRPSVQLAVPLYDDVTRGTARAGGG